MNKIPPSPPREGSAPSRLAQILLGVFFFAVFMGPGPGVYLVTPPAGRSPAVVFGVPVLYLWMILWFFVMVAVILVAYQRLWKDGD